MSARAAIATLEIDMNVSRRIGRDRRGANIENSTNGRSEAVANAAGEVSAEVAAIIEVAMMKGTGIGDVRETTYATRIASASVNENSSQKFGKRPMSKRHRPSRRLKHRAISRRRSRPR
jgi:hypothetical protein